MSIYDTFFDTFFKEEWENIKECFRNGLENVSIVIDKWKVKMDSQDEFRKALEELSYNFCTNMEEYKMTRFEILQKAEAIITGERQQNYGTPEDNFKRVASLWNAYKGDDLFDAVDVAMMMALLKIARISTGTQMEDCFIDLAGYAACGGEIASNEEKR
jgi:hypothetical protein